MPRNAHGSGAAGAEGPERPVTASIAGGLIGLQAVLVAAVSIVLAINGLHPETLDRLGAEILAGIGLCSAVALVALGRGVAARRPWARSPVLVVELIALPVAYNAVQGGRWYAGIPFGVSALAVLALVAASGQLARP